MNWAVAKARKKSADKKGINNKKRIKNIKNVIYQNIFGSLPDDILLEILKRLPDDFLRYKAKYVCRRWSDIITNGILLDHASFILQKSYGSDTVPRHVDISEEPQGLQVKERYLQLPYRCSIESWCNEFLLIKDLYKKGSIYVFNLITNEKAYLPSCTSCVRYYSCQCGAALSFDGGVYKVLRVFMGPPMQCHICILKSDIVSCVSSEWKNIKVPCYVRQTMNSWCQPVSVQAKYFHWRVNYSTYLISMDMEKEVFFQLNLPRRFSKLTLNNYSAFEMGGSLALIGGVNWDKVFIWILKDLQKPKWEKLQSVTFKDPFFEICPIVSVIRKRYIFFMDPRSKSMYGYDMKYGVFKELNINSEFGDVCVVHTSAPSFILSRAIHATDFKNDKYQVGQLKRGGGYFHI